MFTFSSDGEMFLIIGIQVKEKDRWRDKLRDRRRDICRDS
jgi:hypothetical protein